MSRRARMALPLLAALLLVGAPASASAQDAARAATQATGTRAATQARRLEAELRKVLASIGPAKERAALERIRLDSLLAQREQRAANIDTVFAGPLRIVTEADNADDARSAFEAAWREIAPQVGEAADMSEAIFIYDVRRRLRNLHFRESAYVVDGRRWTGDWRVRFDQDLLAERIRHSLGVELTRHAPAGIRSWLRNGSLNPAAEGRLTELYRALILSGTPAAAACVEGDLEGCWSALGFVDDAARMADWIPPAKWSRSCRGWDGLAGLLADTSFLWDLRSQGWVSCVPLDPEFRGDFVAFALARGGEGAIDRLTADWPEDVPISYEVRYSTGIRRRDEQHDPMQNIVTFGTEVRPRIADAANMSEHALMAAWRDRVLNARPDLRSEEDRGRTAAFLWVVFFAAFAMRSTRWRLG